MGRVTVTLTLRNSEEQCLLLRGVEGTPVTSSARSWANVDSKGTAVSHAFQESHVFP